MMIGKKTTTDAARALQSSAGIPNTPTDLTYECRLAVSGEGPRAYEWKDKPHRLVYDLCGQVEAQAAEIAALSAVIDDLMDLCGKRQ